MLSGIMWGLLAPAMKMSGLFDLLNVTLGVVFLPIVMRLMDFLLPIMQWFMDLPAPVQEVIGAIVLFTGVLFGILSFGAFFGLFVASIKTGFITLKTMFATTKILELLGKLSGYASTAVNVTANLVTKLGSSFASFFSTAGKWLVTSVKTTASLVASLGSTFAAFFSTAGKWLVGSVKTLLNLAYDAASTAAVALITWLKGGGAKGRVIPILLKIGLVFAAFEIGAQIGKWINKNVFGGKNVIAEALGGRTISPEPFGGALGGLGFQRGGIVPGPPHKAMPIIAHGGETIIPAHKGAVTEIMFSPTINIERVESEVDLAALKTSLLEDFRDEVQSRIGRL